MTAAHNVLDADVLASLPAGQHKDHPSLWLLVKPTGARSWVGRFYLKGGRETTRGLGAYPEVGLREARRAYERMKEKLRLGGDAAPRSDPLTAPAPDAGPTFGEVAEAVVVREMGERAPGERQSSTEQRWRNALFNHAADLGSRPIRELVVDDIFAVLEAPWVDVPVMARKVREHLETVFDYAIFRKWHPGPNPAIWKGNLDQLLSRERPETTPHAALPWQEAPSFLTSLRKQYGTGPAGLELVVLTGVRTAEVRYATWSEFDLKGRLWSIPRKRTKENATLAKLKVKFKRIPLSEPAVALLERIRPDKAKPTDFVFTELGKEMSENTMLQVLARMGLKGVATTHGFRSTFRDWVAEQRIRMPAGRWVPAYSWAAAEVALGHNVRSRTEAAYHRSDHLDERRDMIEDWAAFLEGRTAEPKDPAEELAAFLRDTGLFEEFQVWKQDRLVA